MLSGPDESIQLVLLIKGGLIRGRTTISADPNLMSLPKLKPVPARSLLIADDHWVVRESIKHVARGIDPSIEIEEAASFSQALAALERNPDFGLLLVDLVMPGFKEFEGLRLLRQRFSSVPIAVISIHEDPENVRRAIQHGVIGYIPKSADADQFRRALSCIFAGEVWFPRDALSRSFPVKEEQAIAEQIDHGLHLTEREIEILTMLGNGLPLTEISDVLAITRQTVRVHLGNAMRKLGLKSREATIRYAVTNFSSAP